MRPAVALACLALLVAATPAAARTWGAPRTLDTARSLLPPAVAVDDQGRAVVAWANTGRIRAALAPPGRPFRHGATLRRAEPPVELTVALSAGRGLVLWDEANVTELERLATARLTRRGFGAVHRLTPFTDGIEDPALVANPHGAALAGWIRGADVRVSSRPRGGRFAPAVTVSSGDAQAPAFALGPDGDAVAAWRSLSTDLILAAFRPGGGDFGAPAQLASGVGNEAEPAVAVGAGGETIVAWTQSDRRVLVASRPAAANAFGAPQAISGRDRVSGSPRVALGTGGEATVLYLAAGGAVRIAFRGAGAGAFAPPVTIAGNAVRQAGRALGADARGRVVAAWEGRAGGRVTILAALGRHGRFGTARRVPARGEDASAPALAVGTRGDAVLAWWGFHATRIRAARLER